MGNTGDIYPNAKDAVFPPAAEGQVRLYNHVEIFGEYKEYCKGKKSFERQSFELWLVETYPNMLYIKRD